MLCVTLYGLVKTTCPRGNGTFDHIPSTLANNSGWESGWEQRQGNPPVRALEDFMV